MRKSTRLLATGLVLAASASVPSFAPALAQEAGAEGSGEEAPDVSTSTPMTDEQKMAYEDWGVDQQAAYNTWPAEVQNYFWGLSESRQKLFFQFSPNDQMTLLSMPDVEREAAWEMVEGRVNDGMPGSETDGGMPGEPAVPDAPPPPPPSTDSEAPETLPPPPTSTRGR